jgi:hypothetical protein
MFAECEAVWTHPLPVHWAILPCDDRAGAGTWAHDGPSLRMVSLGSAHSIGRQNHLVGDGTRLGNLLFAEFARTEFHRD